MTFMVTSQRFLYDIMLILYISHSWKLLQMHLGGTEFFSSGVIMLLIGRRDTAPEWIKSRCWGSVVWPLSQQKGSSPVLSQQVYNKIRIFHLFPPKTSETQKIQDKYAKLKNPNNLKFALMWYITTCNSQAWENFIVHSLNLGGKKTILEEKLLSKTCFSTFLFQEQKQYCYRNRVWPVHSHAGDLAFGLIW